MGIADEYWKETEERLALMNGTREQRLEYQTKSFPVEEGLSSRIDADDASLVDDLVAIAEAAPSDDALGIFGAGMVWETLYNGGPSIAVALESAAESSPRFLAALQAAFAGWDGIKPETKAKLKKYLD